MKTKLNRQDWLSFSLKELARNGHGQLTANNLASKLGVSRGSFYWHFKNVRDFEKALLEMWAELSTNRVILDLKPLSSPKLRLSSLIKRAMGEGMELERAVRSWAIFDKEVAKSVRLVDSRRVEYIEEIFQSMGVAKVAIKPRSQMLYWASIGRLMASGQNIDILSDAELDGFADLLTS